MSYWDTEDDEEEKIPFDAEPIERNQSAEFHRYLKEIKRNEKRNEPQKQKSYLTYLVVGLTVVVALLFVSVVSMGLKLSGMIDYAPSYTMNINAEKGDMSYAIAKGMLSSVSISAANSVYNDNEAEKNKGNITADTFFSNLMDSHGTGVIIELNKENGDAYIVTNYHVLGDKTKKTIYAYRWILLWDSVIPVKAEYIGGSATYDIAVLKVTASEEIKKSSCSYAEIGDSASICLGEEVCAVGNSRARNLRASTGVIAVEEELMPANNNTYDMFLSHNAEINGGNSGGGLYNAKGELIGIVNAKLKDVNSTTGTLLHKEVFQGMNYAIPINIAYNIARNIIKNTSNPKKANIGLEFAVNYSYANKHYDINEEGLGYTTYDMVVTKAVGGFWVNDKLVSITYEYGQEKKTEKLNRIFTLESVLFNLSKGDKITVVVERGGHNTNVAITVDSEISVN